MYHTIYTYTHSILSYTDHRKNFLSVREDCLGECSIKKK